MRHLDFNAIVWLFSISVFYPDILSSGLQVVKWLYITYLDKKKKKSKLFTDSCSSSVCLLSDYTSACKHLNWINTQNLLFFIRSFCTCKHTKTQMYPDSCFQTNYVLCRWRFGRLWQTVSQELIPCHVTPAAWKGLQSVSCHPCSLKTTTQSFSTT